MDVATLSYAVAFICWFLLALGHLTMSPPASLCSDKCYRKCGSKDMPGSRTALPPTALTTRAHAHARPRPPTSAHVPTSLAVPWRALSQVAVPACWLAKSACWEDPARLALTPMARGAAFRRPGLYQEPDRLRGRARKHPRPGQSSSNTKHGCGCFSFDFVSFATRTPHWGPRYAPRSERNRDRPSAHQESNGPGLWLWSWLRCHGCGRGCGCG